ncbi:MAG: hypothetical protein II232_01475 [Spirochaetaceae bacterium]|nr:hypothetical protein [Spirochaetaceae bacterium]
MDVKIAPYGFDYVNIISGLSEGDVVKNQGGGLKSGKLRTTSSRSGNNSNKSSGAGGKMPARMPSGMPGGRP